MTPRRRAVLVAVVALGVVATAVAVVSAQVVRGGGPPPVVGDPTVGEEAGVETAGVRRADLVTTEEIAGTLTYPDRRTLGSTLAGTVTWLPEEGAHVGFGEPLWRVDEYPVILLPGAVPAWRTLNTASAGEDVRQLETWLVNAGYATPEELTVDDDFTNATARAVRVWQAALGVTETGTIELGRIRFETAPVRVAERAVRPGAAAGAELLTVTGTTRTVLADVDAGDAGGLSLDEAVAVELPDDSEVEGTIVAIGQTAAVAEDGSATIELVVTAPDLPAEVADEAPVTVHVTDEAALGVLAVPVEALLALAEGGYAVETESGELIAVETGTFADGLVEVTGDVAEGDSVVVAR